ncbi:hypothetical protein [Streptomyces sp. NPDC001054]
MSAVLHALDTAQSLLLADAPDPSKGGGGNPPGWDKFLTVLHWVFIAVTGVCVIGIMLVAGSMALAYRRGDGSEAAKGLGVVMFACVILGSASGIVTALT